MALLTSTALSEFRDFIKRTVYYARYKYNGSYIKTNLNDITITSAGVVQISFLIEPGSTSGTVTEVQLFDRDSNLWFSKSVNLNMANVAEGFFYLVEIQITEIDK